MEGFVILQSYLLSRLYGVHTHTLVQCTSYSMAAVCSRERGREEHPRRAWGHVRQKQTEVTEISLSHINPSVNGVIIIMSSTSVWPIHTTRLVMGKYHLRAPGTSLLYHWTAANLKLAAEIFKTHRRSKSPHISCCDSITFVVQMLHLEQKPSSSLFNINRAADIPQCPRARRKLNSVVSTLHLIPTAASSFYIRHHIPYNTPIKK